MKNDRRFGGAVAYTSLSPDDLALLHEVVQRHRPELVPLLDALGRTLLPLEQRGQLRMALSCERWKHGAISSEPLTHVTRLRDLSRWIGMRCALDPDDVTLLHAVVADYLPELILRFDGSCRPIFTDAQRHELRNSLVQEIRKAGGGNPPSRGKPTPLAARLATLEGYVWTCSPLLPEDMALLREAVTNHRPALLPTLDNLGETPLTKDQRKELQSGAVLTELLTTGLDDKSQHNERGMRLEYYLDYVRWL